MNEKDTAREPEKPIIRYYRNMNGHLVKTLQSPEYNYVFSLGIGRLMRWGISKDIDPEYCMYGPEILDIEVSTKCSKACPWCYKSNGPVGKNMSFEKFKHIIDIMPLTLTQIAFGIGDIDANPELWQMMRYARDHAIIPNLTINGERMTPQYYDLVASNCGACAVSLYDKDTCYNAVKELTDRRMSQVNIHCLLSEETYDKCLQVIKDRLEDPRLAKMNAIVFLWLKPRGDRNRLHQLSSMDKFKQLIKTAFDSEIKIGFDSCSSPMFLEAIAEREDYYDMERCVDACESTLFSYYINADGIGYPCSFSETLGEGVDLSKTKDFLKDVWNHHSTTRFRGWLEKGKDKRGCRTCPVYPLGPQSISL